MNTSDGDSGGALSVSGPDDVCWKDITKDLKDACGRLEFGGIVRRDGFTFQESMNALELMSPKMDSGMNASEWMDVGQRHKKGIYSLPPRTDLELLAVCDHLLGLEMAWYDGHTLVTSVHSCLYLNKYSLNVLWDQCSDVITRKMKRGSEFSYDGEDATKVLALVSTALFQTVLKTCGIVHTIVKHGDIYEEEDFAPARFGLALGLDIDLDGVERILGLAEIILNGVVDKKAYTGELSEAGCKQLLGLLGFRRKYINALSYMHKEELTGVVEAEGLWKEILSAFDSLGPGRVDKTASELEAEKHVVKVAFDAGINRKILCSSPPRAGPKVDLKETHTLFKDMVSHMLLVCALRHETTYFCLYRALNRLSINEPNIVVRSTIIPMLYSEKQRVLGKYGYEAWIAQNMSEFGVPAEQINSEGGAAYIKFLVKSMYQVLRNVAANRARQRRNIANILPDWNVLYFEGSNYDQEHVQKLVGGKLSEERDLAELRSFMHFSLAGWAEEWTTRLMIYHLLLGFELELYSKFEYDAMMWHLQYLLRKARENRISMNNFNEQTIERLSKSKVKKDKKLAKSLKQKCLSVKSNPLYVKERVFNSIKGFLADGTLRIIIALRKQGRFEYPKYEFGSDRIRYNHRFVPYSFVEYPRALTFDEYLNVTDLSKYEADSLFDDAQAYLKQCKDVISGTMKVGSYDEFEMDELKSLLKVAITNSVTIMRERKQPEGQEIRKVTFEFLENKMFPIITLK